MGKLIRTSAGIASLLFVAATAWSVTVTGFFEETQPNPPHFIAGAGNELLLVRGGLAVLVTLLLLAAVFFVPGRRAKAITALGALLAIPLLLWSSVGIERWAPRFSERAFSTIFERYDRHQRVSVAEVVTVLGPPLYTSGGPLGEAQWSYSYMPSGGFGWHKRMIQFENGFVSSMYSLDEP